MSESMFKRDITRIIIHCSATIGDASVKDIDQWHRARGWREIGYHYVIRRNGDIEVGRSLDKVGAHCKGHNYDSIGICLAGGIDKLSRSVDNFTFSQKKSLTSMITLLQSIKPLKVYGHNEFSDKDCPCMDLSQWQSLN